ncbi:Hypothetical predicted protein [Octopus vulgaris]|uniref:Uncharacterized protein n=1 Tax=Octopus vulgaris TaxID=6645 RepID=A0AA36ANJ7_OCTVU|nr:Hypothetical predicted protein [Octopus vulgaris]
MYAYTCIHTRTYMHACTHRHMHTDTHRHTHTHIHTFTSAYIYTYMQNSLNIRIEENVSTHLNDRLEIATKSLSNHHITSEKIRKRKRIVTFDKIYPLNSLKEMVTIGMSLIMSPRSRLT